MNTNTPFGQLINYEGQNIDALRQYAIAHSGNLIFAHITNSSGEFYYIYANSVEMRIPTLEQFNRLKNYVGTIPVGYSATSIVDFIREYIKTTIISPDDSIVIDTAQDKVVVNYTGVATAEDWGFIPES